MKQTELYDVLKKTGCKILSFEDYPESLGSWRVSFMCKTISCEIVCNRYDAYMIMQSKSLKHGCNRNIIERDKTEFTEEFELTTLANWLSFILAKSATFSEIQSPE